MPKDLNCRIISKLEAIYADRKTALHYSTPFELLIAVILSAQCTDERVNMVTGRLFSQYNTPRKILALGKDRLEEYIRDCGLYRTKARNIIRTCEMIIEVYQGKVPNKFKQLIELPGVGRKTANVILNQLYDAPVIAVDTHVFRVANRLKLGVGNTPEEVEESLMRNVPKSKWGKVHNWLMWHGRLVCKARKPLCGLCPISDLCPSNQIS